MKARGKREAQRNASPLVTKKYFEPSTESAKYQRELFRSFRASRPLRAFTRGDAPHVVRRLPLAFIFRAFGAGSSDKAVQTSKAERYSCATQARALTTRRLRLPESGRL